MEDIVVQLIDRIIANIDMCKCDKCKTDILAIALNKLPPKYIVSEKGELFTKIQSLNEQFEIDIISVVTQAAMQVKQNPRHSLEENE